MASRYVSDYPSLPIDPAIPTFFATFYQISDTPDAHEQYVDAFTDDAVMVMANKKAEGKEGQRPSSGSRLSVLRYVVFSHQHTPSLLSITAVKQDLFCPRRNFSI